MPTLEPQIAALELKNQLSSLTRRTGFLFGAGTSIAAGIPGISELTDQILLELPTPFDDKFRAVLPNSGKKPNLETGLNRVRLIRELLLDDPTTTVDGLNADDAEELDQKICAATAQVIGDRTGSSSPHLEFAQWIHGCYLHRQCPVEIFTTNYDLLLERNLEFAGVPFFDGFVGSVHPFFFPEAVEADGHESSQKFLPPTCWTRLWKLHGSLGWCFVKVPGLGRRVSRFGEGDPSRPNNSAVIFPAREKYSDSRKLPFMALQDRLRKFLTDGDSMLIIAGYSFSDEHINELITGGLQANSKLAVTVLYYAPMSSGLIPTREGLPDFLKNAAEFFPNMFVLSQREAIVNTKSYTWEPSARIASTDRSLFWNDATSEFTLVEFPVFSSFLLATIGGVRKPFTYSAVATTGP